MSAEAVAVFAPIPLLVRGQSYVIGAHPKRKAITYTVGKLVVIRDVDDPAKCEIYTDHLHNVTVAKYAPTGNYVCSGDVSGTIRIWDALGPEQRLKNEFRPFAGLIRDLCWGPESKRIAVCGDGNQLKAACITWDSGNNLGTLNAHDKRANSIHLKPNRPFRLIVGDDTFSTFFYAGPPFKVDKEITDHNNFVNSIQFSPDGKYFATGSSDGRIFLYDGKTGEQVDELVDGKKSHDGGIYGVFWSEDSKELLTVSGDKSAKIWDIESKQKVVKFPMGKDVSDQQLGCVWVRDTMITVSLSGELKYLDRANPEKPLKVLYGHNRAVNVVLAIPSEKPCHISGDASGKLLWWDTDTGEAHPFLGKGHTNKVVGLCYDADSKRIISAGWDDTVRFTSVSDFDFSTGTSVALDAQPKSICLADNHVVVLTVESIVLLKDGKKVHEIAHETGYNAFQPSLVAAYGKCVAVDQKSKAIKIYNIENDALVDSGVEIPSNGTPVGVAYSYDGASVAVGYSDKSVVIYNVADGYKKLQEKNDHHQPPKVLAWSRDSQYLCTTGIDAKLCCHNIATNKTIEVERAHAQALINDMNFMMDGKLLTAGDEGLMKAWTVTW